MARSALNLIWCDLEFTHLEAVRSRILQAAMLVTTPELEAIPPPGTGEGGSLVADGLSFLVRITPEEAALASRWVKANQGELLTRCQTDPAALPAAEVERRLLAYVEAACGAVGGAADLRSNPLLAGNSVHKDYSLLERLMPTLVSRLSYRLVDVSGIKELRRRWYPDVPAFDKDSMARDWLPDLPLEGAEHDALYDVKCSLAELRYYRARVFRQ